MSHTHSQRPTVSPQKHSPAKGERPATDLFSVFVYVLVVAALIGQAGFVVWVIRA